MCQRSVEWVIGRLVTDEGFRRRYREAPREALAELSGAGAVLTDCECRALVTLDPAAAERYAAMLDPRLLKADLSEER